MSRFLHVNFMVTASQKPIIIDTQNIKRKESKHNSKVIQLEGKEQEKKKGTENYKHNQNTTNNMPMSSCLSIVVFTANRVSAAIKREGGRADGKQGMRVLSAGGSLQVERHVETDSEGMQRYAHGIEKEAGVAISMPDNIACKA